MNSQKNERSIPFYLGYYSNKNKSKEYSSCSQNKRLNFEEILPINEAFSHFLKKSEFKREIIKDNFRDSENNHQQFSELHTKILKNRTSVPTKSCDRTFLQNLNKKHFLASNDKNQLFRRNAKMKEFIDSINRISMASTFSTNQESNFQTTKLINLQNNLKNNKNPTQNFQSQMTNRLLKNSDFIFSDDKKQQLNQRLKVETKNIKPINFINEQNGFEKNLFWEGKKLNFEKENRLQQGKQKKFNQFGFFHASKVQNRTKTIQITKKNGDQKLNTIKLKVGFVNFRSFFLALDFVLENDNRKLRNAMKKIKDYVRIFKYIEIRVKESRAIWNVSLKLAFKKLQLNSRYLSKNIVKNQAIVD